MNTNNFKILDLDDSIISNLTSLGFNNMTQIQEKSLPFILKGDDVIAKAKTGSGKTVSFGLGVLNNLDEKRFRIQAMVLCPTRELASQVADTLRKLARYKHNIKILTLTGGLPYKPQVHSLTHQAHIIVGTPGRVLKHLQENNFNPDDINTLVFDEADRMLDMGFTEDIEAIVEYIPNQRQTMLFSATYPDTIEQLSNNFLNNPKTIEVVSTHDDNTITQEFYQVESSLKNSILQNILNNQYKTIIIFCNTKIQCDDLADYLEDSYELEPLVLHSDMEQKYRDETLILFANKSFPILIATDVASRGLDIDNVDLVINYDLPHDLEVYTHRIGRTARAGKSGKAVSFIDDFYYLDELNEFLNKKFKITQTPITNHTPIELKSEFSTLYISGGKKDKLRAGDILGVLTAGIGLAKEQIGKIDILAKCSYVAIKNDVYEKALNELNNRKIKNKYFRVYRR
ncbi:MAG: ATP-dependent RNA helicase DbpA [Campylobacterota bacterium]|nr:ATP-dependent RNA helicase DbpA [Campylobacterota bacterium]